jgi:D-mannonate dehydratase
MKLNFQKDLSYKIQISILQKIKNFKKKNNEEDYVLQNMMKIINSLNKLGLSWNEIKEIEKNENIKNNFKNKNLNIKNENVYDNIINYSIAEVFINTIDECVHTLTSKQISNLFLIFNKMNLKFDIMSQKIQRNGMFFLL